MDMVIRRRFFLSVLVVTGLIYGVCLVTPGCAYDKDKGIIKQFPAEIHTLIKAKWNDIPEEQQLRIARNFEGFAPKKKEAMVTRLMKAIARKGPGIKKDRSWGRCAEQGRRWNRPRWGRDRDEDFRKRVSPPEPRRQDRRGPRDERFPEPDAWEPSEEEIEWFEFFDNWLGEPSEE